MGSNYPVYSSPESTLGAGTANRVLQEQENEAANVKRVSTSATFACTYTWEFENFFKYHIQDSEDVKTEKVKFGSSVWELNVYFRKGDGREDCTVTITFVRVLGISSDVKIEWEMYLVDKNSQRYLMSMGELKNLNIIHRYIFAIGRNLSPGNSYTDLFPDDRLVVYFQLSSDYVLRHQSTWKRDLDIELPNSQRCLTNLSSDLLDLLESCDMSDVTLNVGQRTFKAHKVILSARSGRFSSIFKMKQNVRSLDILDLEAIDMQYLLVYIYSGIVPDLPFVELQLLYAAAYKYEISALQYRCRELMVLRLNTENIGYVQVLARKYDDKELLSTIKSFSIFNQFALLG